MAIDATRRAVLRGIGSAVVLAGCGGTSEGADGGSGDLSGGSTASGDDGATGNDASTAGDASRGDDDSSGATEATGTACGDPAPDWASGGTAAMTATDCYPDPFAAGVGACMLMCETTQGPCTSDTLQRQDVSEGLSGLPVRLALKIVDAQTCEPVAGAYVDIWHTQRTGVYSGVTPAGALCYGDDPSAERALYFRGVQVTDADGRVDFDTCYPGWYGGRAIHIHFRIVVGASAHLVSQLFFDDALNEEICTTHPDYAEFGSPDTTNGSDNILGDEADLSPYLLDTARMPDGALLASKVIGIRASPADPVCST